MGLEISAKLSNWGKVLTTAALILGILYAGVLKVQAIEEQIAQNAKKDEEQDRVLQAQAEQQRLYNEVLAKVAAQLDEIYKGRLVRRGQAFVMEDSQSGEYVQINLLSDAARYRSFESQDIRLRVRNMSHSDRPSLELPIRGTFSNSTDDYLLNLSKEAGGMLRLSNGWMQVVVEPVFEDMEGSQ